MCAKYTGLSIGRAAMPEVPPGPKSFGFQGGSGYNFELGQSKDLA